MIDLTQEQKERPVITIDVEDAIAIGRLLSLHRLRTPIDFEDMVEVNCWLTILDEGLMQVLAEHPEVLAMEVVRD